MEATVPSCFQAGGRVSGVRYRVQAGIKQTPGTLHLITDTLNSKLETISHWVYTYCQALEMKSEKISELTTNRLSVYLRCLNTLAAAGIKTISSQALPEQFNLNSPQIRKDLVYFGAFGVRGVGYYVADLREHITNILGLDKP